MESKYNDYCKSTSKSLYTEILLQILFVFARNNQQFVIFFSVVIKVAGGMDIVYLRMMRTVCPCMMRRQQDKFCQEEGLYVSIVGEISIMLKGKL